MIELDPHDVAPVPSFTNARGLAGIALYSPSEQSGGNRHDQMSMEVLVARMAALLRIPLISDVETTDDVGPDSHCCRERPRVEAHQRGQKVRMSGGPARRTSRLRGAPKRG